MRYILLTFLILTTIISFAQNEGNIWYFGNSAGVDFNGLNPIALTDGAIAFANHTNFIGDPINYNEGTSAISDASGNLLFYSDGQTIWNRNHIVMSNGDSLFGNFSSTQSSIIIPQPESKNLYYIFTVDDVWESDSTYGFRYSIVDMCVDNGNGMVIPSEKNILLLDGAYEKVGAVKHANGIDFWVVTHKLNTNEYYAYLFSQLGISSAVISTIGSVSTYGQGQLKFSPDGSHMAVAHNQHYLSGVQFVLFDFDNSTGVFSNPINLATSTYNVYGVEFSPDNSVLYAVYTQISPSTEFKIVQFDISSGNAATINNSQANIYQTNSAILRGLQLAPNNKIYMVAIPNNSYLLSINNPNIIGTGCNVIDNDIYLGGNIGSNSLPTFVAGYSYDNINFISCELSIDEIASQSSKLTLIKIVDCFGRETEDKPNTLLIYVYSDGTTEKIFRVE